MRSRVVMHEMENFDLAKLHLGCVLRYSSGCQKSSIEPRQNQLCCFLYRSMGIDQFVSIKKVLLKNKGELLNICF